MSDRFAAQTSSVAGDVHGLHLVELVRRMLDTTSPDAAAALLRLGDRIAGRTSFKNLVVPVVVDRERRWWSLTGHHSQGHIGARWRGVGEDVTAARRARDEIVRLATTDPLTGLMNRHSFTERLSDLLASSAPLHLAIIDLDNFKAVNDTLGHPLGDKLLMEVAARLRDSIGADDLCARLGGDEFAVVRVGAVLRRHWSSDLLLVFQEPFAPDGTELAMTASIGSATAPEDATESNDLVVAADLALYAAKSAGGGRAAEFTADLVTAARERATLFADLKRGIERGEFLAWFQPQVNLATGAVDGVEALARWRHPVRGMLTPSSFIPLAEDTGLIGAISQQVLDHACDAARSWPRHVRVSVNVSAGQFADPGLVDRVGDSLRRAGLPPHRLCVEVTESAMVTSSASAALVALRELGVGITVDDFGTGYSSFETLRVLRPSMLKVDRSFVAALDGPEPASARAMLKAFVSLAVALDITTVAEGAETREQRATLRALGFHYSQGFIDAHPAGAEDLSFDQRT